MVKEPLVSILMNCYEGEKYLKLALESVLTQSYKNWELIFWDNNSSDNSLEIVNKLEDKRIRIFKSKQHTNLGKARKNAFSKAQGDYLAFLDVDDIWEKDKLLSQIKQFEDKSVGISFSNTYFFSKKRIETLYKSTQRIKYSSKDLIINYPLSLESIMLNIKQIKKLDYDFDENFSHISDFDLIVRLSTISKVNYLNAILSGWRIHGKNESFMRKEVFVEELERWCNIHIKNKLFNNYTREITELRLKTQAEKRIIRDCINFSDIKTINIKSISSLKNIIFIILSFLPKIPKILFLIKDFRFRKKWY